LPRPTKAAIGDAARPQAVVEERDEPPLHLRLEVDEEVPADDGAVPENKLVQLRAAARAGLRIPATLVSQDPARIRSFCSQHPGAIIKPVATPRGVELARTAVVGQELLDNDDILALTPAIYQECIPGERHLRVSVVGERRVTRAHHGLATAQSLDRSPST
jgi:hypothetical protein